MEDFTVLHMYVCTYTASRIAEASWQVSLPSPMKNFLPGNKHAANKKQIREFHTWVRNFVPRTQSYDLWIYKYNASAVIG
jgi:enolase